jgi:peptidyl-prolyl cis-trans isomerase B (cyclophilin B)
MSRQRSRQSRRHDRIDRTYTDKVKLPGPLRILTNPKLFVAIAIVMVVALVGGMLFVPSVNQSGDGLPTQAGELPDVPRDDEPAVEGQPAAPTPVAAVRRFDAPPPMVVDASKRYLAVIETTGGEFRIELDASAAPEAVNNFVFLAQEGYYNGTPFMELVRNPDGSRFVAQAGDPTGTGLATPGYAIPKEPTTLPFSLGAVGMDSGQFFISYGDYPALNGKHTIMGRVVSGMDVVERLSLLDLTTRVPQGRGDQIVSVRIEEL